MLRYELDKKVYELSVNLEDPKGAMLTVWVPLWLRGEPQKVVVRYDWKKASTLEVPNIPRFFNAMFIRLIQNKFDGIVRSSAKGPFEALKDWFEFRLRNQAERK